MAIMRWVPILCIAFFVTSNAFPADQGAIQVKKQPEIQQIRPQKPVRIKLHRTAKGEYTWDLTGDNADEIARIDSKLRKLLKVEGE